MNKKVGSALFTIGATLLNLIIMAGVAALLIFLFFNVLGADPGSSSGLIIILAAFVLSIGISFYAYTAIMKAICRKWDLSGYVSDSLLPPDAKKKGE